MKRETLQIVCKFIDWMMRLPEELENEIFKERKAIEEAKGMSLLTTAERMGIEQAIQSTHRIIATFINGKFGEDGRKLAERTHKVNHLEILEKLSEKFAQAQNVSEAEKIFDEIELPS